MWSVGWGLFLIAVGILVGVVIGIVFVWVLLYLITRDE